MSIVKKIRQYVISDIDRIEILRGATSAFILKVAGMGFGYLFNLMLARMFGAGILGLYGLTLTLFSISHLVAKFGTPTSSIKFISKAASQGGQNEIRATYAHILKLVLPLSIGVGVLLYMAAPHAAALFEASDMNMATRWVAVAVPLGAIVGVNQGCLRGLKKIRASVLHQSLLPPVLNLVGISVFLTAGWQGPLIPIYALVAAYGIMAISSTTTWYRLVGQVNQGNISEESRSQVPKVKEIAAVSWPLLITAAMHLVMGWADEFILGIFGNTDDVGVYRIAYKISLVTGFALQAVNSITAPKISEFYSRGDSTRLNDLVNSSSNLIFWASTPILVVIVSFPEYILSFFGPEFARATFALIVLCSGQFLAAACGPVGYMLTMTGYERVFQLIIIGGAVMNIALNTILIPLYGVSGAAIATAVSLVLWNLVASLVTNRIFGYWVGYVPSFLRESSTEN